MLLQGGASSSFRKKKKKASRSLHARQQHTATAPRRYRATSSQTHEAHRQLNLQCQPSELHLNCRPFHATTPRPNAPSTILDLKWNTSEATPAPKMQQPHTKHATRSNAQASEPPQVQPSIRPPCMQQCTTGNAQHSTSPAGLVTVS